MPTKSDFLKYTSLVRPKLLCPFREAVDYEIDQLVYKLYNLTPEEVKIVEGK